MYRKHLLVLFVTLTLGACGGTTQDNANNENTEQENLDTDGAGIPDEQELALGEVPLLNRATGYVQLTAETADLYRTPAASPRKVPTALTVPTVGLDPDNASDDTEDFDGDGVNNIDEINNGTNPFVATSTGKFGDASNFAIPSVASSPEEIVLGDLNDDGNLDALVATLGFTLEVFLGDGTGAFSFLATYFATNSLLGLVLGDFNADGILDPTVAYFGGQVLGVFQGIGDGTLGADDNPADGIEFGNQTTYPADDAPVNVVTADFDGDNDLDLAASNIFPTPGTVSVLLNQGDGTYGPPQDLPVGTQPTGLVTVDLNGDMTLDLVVTNSGDDTISILLGNGDGTFQDASQVAVGQRPIDIIAGDFDQDSDLDLAVTNNDDNTVSVLINDGNGGLGTSKTFLTFAKPTGIATADLNGNGRLDLVIANGDDNSVSIFFGEGNSAFSFSENKAVGIGPIYPFLGDVDNDGDIDIAVSNNDDASNNFSVLLNQ